MFFQGGENALDRQANDIAHRAFDAFDQASLVLLGGIAAGFVQGIDASQIIVKINGLPRTKLHPSRFDEAEEFAFALLHQADARQHFVNPAAKPFQHGPRFDRGRVGFPKILPLERDHGVGAQNNAVGKPRRDFNRLLLRIEQAKLPRSPISSGQFFDPRGLHSKIDARAFEQIAPSRRSGRQEEVSLRRQSIGVQSKRARTSRISRLKGAD